MQEGVIACAGNVCHLKATVIIEQNDPDHSKINILKLKSNHISIIAGRFYDKY